MPEPILPYKKKDRQKKNEKKSDNLVEMASGLLVEAQLL